ncbi:hypothetical protein O6H91_22G005400 [Diphasiastrum complanatum]|uniref:Uncharacterized protein n=1 Tax=Diphasiastrum complanatum TaxID=34168 RepID=A0ACC2ACC0_DIPCM|nr:hypothetical protein O6H91_22G005400 [Diphasiastrum complanatum]
MKDGTTCYLSLLAAMFQVAYSHILLSTILSFNTKTSSRIVFTPMCNTYFKNLLLNVLKSPPSFQEPVSQQITCSSLSSYPLLCPPSFYYPLIYPQNMHTFLLSTPLVPLGIDVSMQMLGG